MPKEAVFREVYRILDRYYRRVYTRKRFLEEMRRYGYSPSEADILYGKFLAGELIPAPAPWYEYIDVDAETGLDLFWDPRRGVYVRYDPETGEEETSDTIEIEYTASVETDGHEKFYAEATGYTSVSGMSPSEIERVVSDLQTKLNDFFKAIPGFDQIKSSLQKEGVRFRFGVKEVEYPTAKAVVEKTYPRHSGPFEGEVTL